MFARARWRLALWYAAAFTVLLVALGVSAYFVMARQLDREIDDSLERALFELSSGPVRIDPPRDDDIHVWGGPPPGAGSKLSTDVFFFVIAPDTELLTNPREFDAASLPLDRLIQAPGEPARSTEFSAEGERYRVLGLGDFVTSDGEQVTLVVGRSLNSRDYQLRLLATVLGLGGLGGIVLATAGGFWLAGRALVPIRESLDTQRRFVSDASHELRTPIAVMKANAELLLRHPDQTVEANIDQVAAINEESDHLTRLVGDLLTLARADEQRIEVVTRRVDLRELLESLVRDMTALAEAKGVALHAELAPCAVDGDAQRLRQLATILLDNALKFTPPGGEVTVSSLRQGSRVEFAVRDTGPGIAASDLPRIFDRFFRVDQARAPQTGTGLGLAIARWIAEAHGGRVTAASTPGEGATFTVRLPAA